MKEISEYIYEQQAENVNEGLLRGGAAIMIAKRMDDNEFLEGLLNLADGLIDNADADLLIQDYPLKQRPLWKELINMHEKGLYSIAVTDEEEGFDEIINTFQENDNKPIKLTPEMRRVIRSFKLAEGTDINLIAEIFPIEDTMQDRHYIFCMNKQTGILNRIFGAAGKKILEIILQKVSAE